MSLRIRILRAIERAPATADEIAAVTKDDRKRIISNIGSICTDGIVQRISGVDGTIEYKLTAAGRAYLARNAPAAAVDRESVQAEPSATLVIAPEPGVEVDEVEALEAGNDSPAAEDAKPADDVSASDLPPTPDPVETDLSPAAPAPIEGADLSLYAIFGATLANPEIAGPTLSDAQRQTISLAYDTGADLTLYRLVPIGETKTAVTFVEA